MTSLSRPRRFLFRAPAAAGRRQLACALVLGCALVCLQVQAQVYVGETSQGSVVLSNHPGEQASELLIPGDPSAQPSTLPTPPADARIASAAVPRRPPADLASAIRRTADRHALPEALLTALIAVESGFDRRAVSPKGARGLMQLMPATARRFGVRDVFSVDDNLEGGATYLRWLLGHFDHDVALALAAYNAGEGAVERAGRRIPAFRETQDYVRKVMALAQAGGQQQAAAAQN